MQPRIIKLWWMNDRFLFQGFVLYSYVLFIQQYTKSTSTTNSQSYVPLKINHIFRIVFYFIHPTVSNWLLQFVLITKYEAGVPAFISYHIELKHDWAQQKLSIPLRCSGFNEQMNYFHVHISRNSSQKKMGTQSYFCWRPDDAWSNWKIIN